MRILPTIAIIGVALTLVSAGMSFSGILPSVMPFGVGAIVLAVELAIGGAAIHELMRVNRKVSALTRQRSAPTREAPSLGAAEMGPEAPLC